MVVESFILYSLPNSIADVCNWVLSRTYHSKISILSEFDLLYPRRCQPITNLVSHVILLSGYCRSGEKQGLASYLQIPCNDGNAAGTCSTDSVHCKQLHATYTLPRGHIGVILLGWYCIGIYFYNDKVHKVCASGNICEHPFG